MQSIRRGTTPTIQFTTTLTENDVSAVYVTIRQGDHVIEKDNNSIVWLESKIVISLTQEETLGLHTGLADVQIRVKLANSQATATQILAIQVNDILKEGVI